MTSDSPWIRIGRLTFLRRMALVATGAGALLVVYPGFFLGPELGAILAPDVPFPLRLALSVSAGLLLSLIVIAAVASWYPGLHVRADGSELRLRNRTVPAAAFDRASLLMDRGSRNGQDLVLQLTAGRRTTRLWLRTGSRVLLADEERAVLARAIERSTIAPPTSVHDPSGRFARYNFPGSLTREETLSLVQDVPRPGDPLPLTS